MNIHDKIIKLRSRVPERGATEAEAIAALAVADRLMAEHGITEAMLRKVEIKVDMRRGTHAQRQKVQHPSSKWCLVAIGEFTHTIVWYDRGEGQPAMFGLIPDVEMAEFLLMLIHNSMDRGWKDFLLINPKLPGISRHTQYWSFMSGFAIAINHKFAELIDAREIKLDSTGTDLVVVQMNIVQDAIELMIPALKLKASPKRRRNHYGHASAAGRIAGDAVNLSRPIKGNAARRQIA